MDFKFELLKDGTYEIKAYFGKDEKVVIPSEYNGKIVTRIGKQAFGKFGDDREFIWLDDDYLPVDELDDFIEDQEQLDSSIISLI